MTDVAFSSGWFRSVNKFGRLKKRRAGSHAPVRLEPLEPRTLLSTEVIVITGDAMPGGGVLQNIGLGLPSLNNDGTVAFRAQMVGTAGGTNDNVGIFTGDAQGVTQIMREGQAAPDGVSTFSETLLTLSGRVAINDAGHVAFTATYADLDFAVIRAQGGTLTQVARSGQAAADGDGTYTGFSDPRLSSAGHLLFSAGLNGVAAEDVDAAIVRVAPTNAAAIIAHEFDAAPDGNGFLSTPSPDSINSAGQVAFSQIFLTGAGALNGAGVLTGNGGPLSLLMRTNQVIPGGGGTFSGFTVAPSLINDTGQTAFGATFTGALGPGAGIYRSQGGVLTTIVDTRTELPTGETFSALDHYDFNNAGQVLFNDNTEGLFVGDGQSIRTVVPRGVAAPDGEGILILLAGLEGSRMDLNDAGQVAFYATVQGGDVFDDEGIYFHDQNLGLLQVAGKGESFLGSTITDLAFSPGGTVDSAAAAIGKAYGGFNDQGQVAYEFALADGRTGIAIWTPPTGFDYGDAPDSYGTLRDSGGARHALGGPHLGGAPDAEDDGQPGASAAGDDNNTDDENGVSFGGALLTGASTQVTVTASAASKLDAWFDFNRDGDFGDAGEKVFNNVALAAGANALNVSVPAGASLGGSYARFRVSTAGGLAPGGTADDGEVEDYAVTIQQTPPTVTLTVTDPTATEEPSLKGPLPGGSVAALENGTPGNVRVTRTGPTTAALDVFYSIGGTATNTDDYETITGVATIPAGQTFADIRITPLDDGEVEASETVELTLESDGGYVVGAATTGTVTIADNDTVAVPTVTIQATDPNALEGGQDPGGFTVTRTGSTAADLTVFYSVGGTAVDGGDFLALSGSVTIPAGQTTAGITVTAIDDGTSEPAESVVVTLTDAAEYNLGTPASDTVTIAGDDPNPELPTVTIVAADATASEDGEQTGAFTITRSGSTSGVLAVGYAVSGTAGHGSDYAFLPLGVVIPDGVASVVVFITPIDDPSVESDETVVLTLTTSATYAVGGTGSNSLIITDNDVAPPDNTVTVAATDAAAAEIGPDTGTFNITRTGPTDSPLDVRYDLDGSAISSVDYASLSGLVTIPAGESSVTITITPIADAADENSETVVLTVVLNGQEYEVGTPSAATVTIADAAGGEGANLIVSVDGAALPGTLIPGDSLGLAGDVTNTGNFAAVGAVRVDFFLLPDGQAELGAGDAPIGSVTVKSPIDPGESASFKSKGLVPSNLPVGQYRVVAVADAGNAVVETDEGDNTAALAATELALKFGTVAGRSRAVSRLVVNGNTYSMRGAGTGRVIAGQNGQPDSVVLDTDSSGAASLTVKGPRGGTPAIEDVTINGSAKTANLKGFAINGSVNVTGTLGSLTVGNFKDDHELIIGGDDPTGKLQFTFNALEVENLSIVSSIPIKTIKVTSWKDTDAVPDTITAPWINSVTSAGDFAAGITVTDATPKNSLNKLTVKGVLSSLIRSAGSVGSVTAGRIVNSAILVAVDDTVTGMPTQPGDFAAGSAATLGKVTAKGITGGGPSFVASVLAAPNVGAISLKDVQIDNADAPFGIVADVAIKSVKRLNAAPLANLASLGEVVDDDFVLRIV